jgi:hypothetical protein
MRAEEERRKTGKESGSKRIPTMRKLLRCYLWNSLLTAAFIPPFAMDQSIARRTLQELIKREDLKNKSCVDCGNPNPQWASLRFAQFIPSTRHFPKTALTASPYLSAYNARGFTEVSACTSGELIYVILGDSSVSLIRA